MLQLFPLGCQCCPLVAAFTYYINEDVQALKMLWSQANQQTDKHTHIFQCSPSSVGLARAHAPQLFFMQMCT